MSSRQAACPPIPDTLTTALSPAWLTAALRTRYPDVTVTAVTPGPVVSRVSTNARFRIQCADGLPAGLSPDLCVKGYFRDQGQPIQAAGVPEGLFYRDLVEATGIRTLPKVYVDVDVDRRAGVLVTEDVAARGGVFLDALSPYTADQLALSLEQLAGMHAATWMNPVVEQAAWMKPSLPHLLHSRGIPEISYNFDGPIGAGVPEPVRVAQRLYDGYSVVATEALTASPWAVIHGDAHIGNWFVDAAGRPSLVDWQLTQRGPWYLDVGYHIASALPVDERRRVERDLVRHYLGRLAAAGVDAPDEDEAWRGVRRGMIHGFYLWGITQKVHPSITTELLRRLGTAVDDHDALTDVEGGRPA
jgi:Phosphotransferase enzyme family